MALKRETLAKQVTKDMDTSSLLASSPTMRDNREPMKLYQIRFPEKDINLLKEHFDSEGLSLSAGIRMAVSKYMRSEGLK